MNQKAQKLGMTHTHFEDCCGLSDDALEIKYFFPAGTVLKAGEQRTLAVCFDTDIRIEKRPWCELTLDGDLHYKNDVDVYRRAVFAPLEGSGCCYDRGYTLGPRSLRI